jgi:DNA-binding beta-propeller fold protein YncE
MARLVALALACAALGGSARAAPAPAGDARAWPAPPAAPRARFEASFPPPVEARPAPPWWKRALRAVAGLEPAPPEGVAFARPFGVAARDGAVLVADPDAGEVTLVEPRRAPRRLACAGRAWQAPIAAAPGPEGSWLVADGGELVRIDARGGCRPFGAGRVERPTGVVHANGRTYAVDPPRHAVVAFDDAGAEVLRFGGPGGGGERLNFPTAIAADADGSLLVVDALNFRIARFSPDGRLLGAFGRPGDEVGQFGRPKGIAVGPGGRIFVSDAQWDVVLVFARDGAFDYLLGGSGEAPGQLLLPAGVAIDRDRLFVANAQNARVDAFALLGDGS